MKVVYHPKWLLVFFILSLCGWPSQIRAQESFDASVDIALLMQEADTLLDMSGEDAVILYDSERIRLDKDGRYTRSVHRIIWINSDVAIGRYGDHRIPYDATHCTFNIKTVRTWRDNQWWETKPSGFVETTSDQLENAYDYLNMREMMLLHDGIELPCILEVAYSIEDKETFRRGWDGSWTFVREEPVIQSSFGFDLPAGWWPNVYEKPAIPPPSKWTDNNLGLDIFTWKRGPYLAAPYPPTGDPGETESFILWSTWKDWSSFGAHIRSRFDPAAVGDADLKQQLDSLMENTFTTLKRARAIAKFINDKTRLIDYPWIYWISNPRPAVETYSSAYGHALDRAVLAAALFSKAGISTLPAFFAKSYGDIDVNVPGTARLSEFGLWLSADDLAAYYDPFDGDIKSGPNGFFSRTVWLAGTDDKPGIRINGLDKSSRSDVVIELSYDAEKKSFSGSGYLFADNYFTPYLEMAGLDDEAFTYLDTLVSSIFENAKLTGYNPNEFARNRTIVGFKFDMEKPEADKPDQINLEIGEATCSIPASLPENTELYHNMRTSAVRFPCKLSQKIAVILNLKGLETVYFPGNDSLHNAAGDFVIHSVKTDKKLIVVRQLDLSKNEYLPEDWPVLRELLLADRNDGNRKVVIKTNLDK